MLGLAGVTAIEVSVAGLTVSAVVPVTRQVAVIEDVPIATPLARPVPVIVATEWWPRPRSPGWSGPPSCRPCRCRWRRTARCPVAMLGLAGVTAIEVSVGGADRQSVVPVTRPRVAVIVEARRDTTWPGPYC